MEELQFVWGWQPALYLFLGGVGAGAFLAAGVLFLTDREHNRAAIAASLWAAPVCLGVGLLLLLSELTAPARGLLLWQSFSNQTSWMAFGAWAALLALVFFALTAIVVTRPIEAAIERKWPGFATKKRRIATVPTVIGMVLALCVAVYTGMLLMAVPAVPLWGTPLLPCLFTVSAIDTGVALVEIAALAVHRREPLTHRARKLLERSVVVLVLVEGVVLAAYMGIMATGNGGGAFTHGSAALTAALSAWTLTSGELAPFFWGLLVACGLVLPLVMAAIGLAKGQHATAPQAEASLAASAEAVCPPQAATITTASETAFAEQTASAAEEAAATSAPEETPSAAAPAFSAAMLVGALGALVGGCTLRFLILLTGQHADLIATSAMQLLL